MFIQTPVTLAYHISFCFFRHFVFGFHFVYLTRGISHVRIDAATVMNPDRAVVSIALPILEPTVHDIVGTAKQLIYTRKFKRAAEVLFIPAHRHFVLRHYFRRGICHACHNRNSTLTTAPYFDTIDL